MTEIKSSEWINIIPEFFYDLISRVPAGFFLIVSVLLVYPTTVTTGTPTTGTVATVPIEVIDELLKHFAHATNFIVLIGSAYVVGILLTPLGGLVNRIYFYRTWFMVLSQFRTRLNLRFASLPGSANQKEMGASDQLSGPDEPRPTSASATCIPCRKYLAKYDLGNSYRILHDNLKEHNHRARILLPKLRAENALCDNLAATSIVVFLCYIVLNFTGSGFLKALTIETIVFLSLLAAGFYRHGRVLQGLLSYAALQKTEIPEFLLKANGNSCAVLGFITRMKDKITEKAKRLSGKQKSVP